MIGEHYALELMRDRERRLVQMNTREGPRWYVVPGGQVSEETAHKIKSAFACERWPRWPVPRPRSNLEISMSERARFVVTFTPAPGVDAVRGLRRVLKIAGRRFGLVAIDAYEDRSSPLEISNQAANEFKQLRDEIVTERARQHHIAELKHLIEVEGFAPKDFFLTAPPARTRTRERRRRLIAQHLYSHNLSAHDLADIGAASCQNTPAPMEDGIMDMSQYASGSFLKVAAVKAEGPLTVVIVAVEVGKFKRPNITFSDGRILSLGKNNVGKLIAAWGAESDDWLQRQVELSVDKVEIDGEMKEVIITTPISPPPETKAPVKPHKKRNAGGSTEGDLDDQIPFTWAAMTAIALLALLSGATSLFA